VRLGKPVEKKRLTSMEMSTETADIISMQVMKAIANCDLDTKGVGLSADTANAHFGGVFRRGKERVLTKN
jgi:hypothetical protein